MTVMKVRPSCSGTWLVCSSHEAVMSAVADIIAEDGADADIEIEAIEMSSAEFEAMPEFGGW